MLGHCTFSLVGFGLVMVLTFLVNTCTTFLKCWRDLILFSQQAGKLRSERGSVIFYFIFILFVWSWQPVANLVETNKQKIIKYV
jgi:hypothetical protein